MILTPVSDLATRRIMWAGRKTDLGPQTMGNDLPIVVESEWIAGAYADRYADDVRPVTFED